MPTYLHAYMRICVATHPVHCLIFELVLQNVFAERTGKVMMSYVLILAWIELSFYGQYS